MRGMTNNTKNSSVCFIAPMFQIERHRPTHDPVCVGAVVRPRAGNSSRPFCAVLLRATATRTNAEAGHLGLQSARWAAVRVTVRREAEDI